MNSQLSYSLEELQRFCECYHINSLAIFGSAVRDDFTPQSDVDILVEFAADFIPGFFKLYELEQELSGIFGGRKIDLKTPEDISRHIRPQVLNQAEVRYVHR